MLSLKEDLVSACDYLKEGGFTGSITDNPHSRLPFDHIIETTLNKECKGIDGIGGNTENLGATERGENGPEGSQKDKEKACRFRAFSDSS